jgi:hypothetical protein
MNHLADPVVRIRNVGINPGGLRKLRGAVNLWMEQPEDFH